MTTQENAAYAVPDVRAAVLARIADYRAEYPALAPVWEALAAEVERHEIDNHGDDVLPILYCMACGGLDAAYRVCPFVARLAAALGVSPDSPGGEPWKRHNVSCVLSLVETWTGGEPLTALRCSCPPSAEAPAAHAEGEPGKPWKAHRWPCTLFYTAAWHEDGSPRGFSCTCAPQAPARSASGASPEATA